MKKLSYNSALGYLKLVSGRDPVQVVEALGCTQEAYNTTTGDSPWTAGDKNAVRRVLESIIYGMVDVMGLERSGPMPAEFLAATIVCFVAPVNVQVAANWISNTVKAEDLQQAQEDSPLEGFERVTPQQVVGLIGDMYNSEAVATVIKTFAKKFKRQVGYQGG